jgi:hypothetical protein
MLLSLNVTNYQEALIRNLKRCFRIVAFGSEQTIELETSMLSRDQKLSTVLEGKSGGRDDDAEVKTQRLTIDAVPSGSDIEGGVLLLDALGDAPRYDFVQCLCQDYLRNYVKDFEPPVRHETATTKRRINSFKAIPSGNEPVKSVYGLAEMEQRFNWFQDVLQNAVRTFPMIPPRWNLMTDMSRCFLKTVRNSFGVYYYPIGVISHGCQMPHFRPESTFLPYWMGRAGTQIPTTRLYF